MVALLINKLEEMKAEIEELENDFSIHTLDQLVKSNYSVPNNKNIEEPAEDFAKVLEREEGVALGLNNKSCKASSLSVPGNNIPE